MYAFNFYLPVPHYLRLSVTATFYLYKFYRLLTFSYIRNIWKEGVDLQIWNINLMFKGIAVTSWLMEVCCGSWKIFGQFGVLLLFLLPFSHLSSFWLTGMWWVSLIDVKCTCVFFKDCLYTVTCRCVILLYVKWVYYLHIIQTCQKFNTRLSKRCPKVTAGWPKYRLLLAEKAVRKKVSSCRINLTRGRNELPIRHSFS